jgi:hypothetical protein
LYIKSWALFDFAAHVTIRSGESTTIFTIACTYVAGKVIKYGFGRLEPGSTQGIYS